MSIVIYTYHDPYKIDQEPYWDEIKNCPYFCSAQTLVNGLRSHYKEKFDGGRVSTVKILTDSLYVDWASPAWIVKQHTDIDNIINSGFSTDLSESERINIGRAFLFNRDDVFASIRTMFELNVDPSAILKNKLTKEQRFILGIYQKILATVYKGNIIKNLIMDCQSYTKYRPNETTGGIFVSWRRKEELPTGA